MGLLASVGLPLGAVVGCRLVACVLSLATVSWVLLASEGFSLRAVTRHLLSPKGLSLGSRMGSLRSVGAALGVGGLAAEWGILEALFVTGVRLLLFLLARRLILFVQVVTARYGTGCRQNSASDPGRELKLVNKVKLEHLPSRFYQNPRSVPRR